MRTHFRPRGRRMMVGVIRASDGGCREQKKHRRKQKQAHAVSDPGTDLVVRGRVDTAHRDFSFSYV